MQLVHSFSAKGCSIENLFYHCVTFVLSCLYAKQNGFKINLHCDKLTNKYLVFVLFLLLYSLYLF